jgi:putative transposase
MEKENTIQTTTKIEKKEEENYITRKIRIYPNQQQKILFNKCLNVSRYFYNKANEYVKKLNENSNKKEETIIQKPVKKPAKKPVKKPAKKPVKKPAKKPVKKPVKNTKKENSFILPSAIKLREKILISDSKLSDKDKWQKEVPYDTRELSIRRLYKSYKTSFSLMKNGFINKFDIKYKKKKDNNKSFEINKNAIKITDKGEFRIFPTRLKEKIRVRKRDRKKIKDLKINKPYTNTIIKKENNRWYICLNIPKNKIIENKDKPIYSSVFLDPGVRKFQTFYSPDGICGKLGERFSKKEINPLIKEYELYQKILGKNKIKGLKRRCRELITKVQNKVSDLHNQISNFLSTTFESIFIPKFETKKMTNKETRNISKYTVKSMLKLSHYKFREKLKNMCIIRGNNIKIITEEFTSKTCTGCGKINKDIGSKEIFKCQKCEIEIDRDINASRNICIKNIKENGASPQK